MKSDDQKYKTENKKKIFTGKIQRKQNLMTQKCKEHVGIYMPMPFTKGALRNEHNYNVKKRGKTNQKSRKCMVKLETLNTSVFDTHITIILVYYSCNEHYLRFLIFVVEC